MLSFCFLVQVLPEGFVPCFPPRPALLATLDFGLLRTSCALAASFADAKCTCFCFDVSYSSWN